MTDPARPLVGDAARFLPLTPQVFQILLSLHDEPKHGYSIIQDIRHRTADEMRLTASTLYDAIARLAGHSLIEELAPDAVNGATSKPDKRRRYYTLTPLGRDVVAAEARRLERALAMARAIGVRTANG